jgi:peptidoglycan/xylan/chitin deacetylase (PgdA/CDA1 family)
MVSLSQTYRNAVGLLAQGVVGRAVSQWQPRGRVLTFHGLRSPDDDLLLDKPLHTPVEVFRAICRHLAENYRVVPLRDLVPGSQTAARGTADGVAITFDDGYASNYELAFPVLREFGLPATIFLTSGFLDRTVRLWFHRIEQALMRTRLEQCRIREHRIDVSLESPSARADALGILLPVVKSLPQENIDEQVTRIESVLQVEGNSDAAAEPLTHRPMTWEQAREMQASGLIELGGHTHRHWILGRCRPETAAFEIRHSAERITTELGRAPKLFAYPNGQPGDYGPATIETLRRAGYVAAVTTSAGGIGGSGSAFELPRYGAPESLPEAAATVSGLFELLKGLRTRVSPAG